MMYDVVKAVQSWYDDHGVLTGLSSGLYPEPAPSPDQDGPSLPFTTYLIVGCTPDNARLQVVDNLLVTFYARSGELSPRSVLQLWDAIRSRFDEANIPIAGHCTVRCDRVGGGTLIKDEDGGWVVPAAYRLIVQEGA